MDLQQKYIRRRNLSLTDQRNDQFLHTLKWNMMLQHFYDNISLKRRKTGPEQSCMCFTGSNAVNILFAFLKKNPTLFSSCNAIKRSNIVSLCNLYLQTGNIEVVTHRNSSPKIRIKFKDSSSSYYRFTERAVSTLVQSQRGSATLKRKSCVKSMFVGEGESVEEQVRSSMPVSKHGSVESLFERFQKSCRKVKKPSPLDSAEKRKHFMGNSAGSLSPKCLKKLSAICFDGKLRSVVN